MNNLPPNVTEVFNDGQQAYYKVRMNFSDTFKPSLTDRITEYLTHGGLYNPEHMDHDKVRDLLIECRDELMKGNITIKTIYELAKENYKP